jgi:outer membrane protein assembly factor BamD
MKFKIIIITICSFLLISCASKKIDELAGLTPEQLYQEGMKKMRAESYSGSLKYFDRINQEFPYSSLASRSQLMESYAYYKTGKYEYALASLEDYISLYPGEKSIQYAYYLKSLCYYNQILEVRFDQHTTEQAKTSLMEIINRFPESKYSRDAKFKLSLVLDHLAGKEMEIGCFYLNQGSIIAAINRFQIVVLQYQSTSQIQEALYRLVECYYILGVEEEAKKYAAVLGNNYPESKWYKHSYNLLEGNNAKASKN